MNFSNIENNNKFSEYFFFNLKDIDINKIFVSKKESYGTKNAIKYFIGYIDNNEIKPICIMLPQMIG